MQTIKAEISRLIRAPREKVFRWWTDYSEDDPKLCKTLTSRRIVRREERLVVFEDTSLVSGLPSRRTFTVNLHPPDGWTAELRGDLYDASLTYTLEDAPGGTRLTLRAEITPKEGCPIKTPEDYAQRVNSTWDYYVPALEREVGEAPGSR